MFISIRTLDLLTLLCVLEKLKACARYFLSNFYFFSPNDSPLKTMKFFFLFHLKSFFRSRDIQIFVIFPFPHFPHSNRQIELD